MPRDARSGAATRPRSGHRPALSASRCTATWAGSPRAPRTVGRVGALRRTRAGVRTRAVPRTGSRTRRRSRAQGCARTWLPGPESRGDCGSCGARGRADGGCDLVRLDVSEPVADCATVQAHERAALPARAQGCQVGDGHAPALGQVVGREGDCRRRRVDCSCRENRVLRGPETSRALPRGRTDVLRFLGFPSARDAIGCVMLAAWFVPTPSAGLTRPEVGYLKPCRPGMFPDHLATGAPARILEHVQATPRKSGSDMTQLARRA